MAARALLRCNEHAALIVEIDKMASSALAATCSRRRADLIICLTGKFLVMRYLVSTRGDAITSRAKRMHHE